ncbi:MAG: hypothetical protein AB8H12_21260 [Lewinella sp.]
MFYVLRKLDKAINLCEFKFYRFPIAFNPKELQRLEERKEAFRELSGTNKVIFSFMISFKGPASKTQVGEVINQSITLEALFE